MKQIVFSFLLLIAAVATAQTNFLTGVQDPFAELQNRFESASAPMAQSIQGWYSGRCFGADNHETAKPTLFVGDYVSVGSDRGPLFPPQAVFKIILIDYSGATSADFFDHLTPDITAQIRDFVPTVFNGEQVTPAELSQGSLASTNVPGGLQYQVRKSGDYFFVRNVITNDSNENYKVGDTYAMCYYFKKLR